MNRIFISYRRADTEADAGRLYESLAAEFGSSALFKDVDHVPLGGDILKHIDDAIAQSSAMVVLVGPNWLAGNRLEAKNDWIRIELEFALERELLIIPIRVRRAELPAPSDVPESVRAFCGLNAAELEHHSWTRDLRPSLTYYGLCGNTTTTKPTAPQPSPPKRHPRVSGRASSYDRPTTPALLPFRAVMSRFISATK